MVQIQSQDVRRLVKSVVHRERKSLPFYFVLPCLLALTGISCTTLSVSEYKVPALDEYALVERYGGVAVAIFPMHDLDEQNKYFGTDLTDHGVLPISVIVRNNSSSSYLLSGNQIQINSTENQSDRTEISDDAATAADVAAVALISPAMIVVGGQMRSNSSVVRHSLEKNELHRTIVSPGGVKHGFIYAPLKEEQRTIFITIPLQDLETSLETPYRFQIDLNQ